MEFLGIVTDSYYSINLRENGVKRRNAEQLIENSGVDCSGVGFKGRFCFGTDGQRRQIAFPCILKTLAQIAFEAGGVAMVKGAAADAEVVEKRSQLLPGFAGPGAPRSIFKFDEPGQKFARGEVIGIAHVMKNLSNVIQKLERKAVLSEVEDRSHGGTRPLRPGTTDEVGDVEERLDAGLLSRRQVGWKLRRSILGDLGESARVVQGPAVHPARQFDAGIAGGTEVETGNHIRRFFAAKQDWNTAAGQGARQRGMTSEDFGAEQVVISMA